jgi:hypothetical protein
VRHLRMVGLCLVAVFAMAAVVATSASALPEFGQCFKKGPGSKYTDSNCTKKSTLKTPGEFEWRKATEVANKTFVGTGGAGVLETNIYACESQKVRAQNCPEGEKEVILLKEVKVECESETNHGEITGTKEVKNVAVTFRGCKLFGNSPCSNTETAGEIHVNQLKGKLGFINKNANPREVGLLLEPAVKKGRFAQFACFGGQLTTVVGVGNEKEGCFYPQKACGGDGIIAPVTPVNTMTKELTQKYAINEETLENIPSKFEGTAPLKVLEDYVYNAEEPAFTSKWSPAGEAVTNVAVSEEAGEIKAN